MVGGWGRARWPPLRSTCDTTCTLLQPTTERHAMQLNAAACASALLNNAPRLFARWPGQAARGRHQQCIPCQGKSHVTCAGRSRLGGLSNTSKRLGGLSHGRMAIQRISVRGAMCTAQISATSSKSKNSAFSLSSPSMTISVSLILMFSGSSPYCFSTRASSAVYFRMTSALSSW